jgi:hypothetical protein
MESLSGKEREEALSCIGRICAFRIQNRPEHEVAHRAGFQSVGEMEQQLEWWGLPQWIIRGDAPPKLKESMAAGEQRPRSDRKAKQFGESKPLPPAEEAIDLLRAPLESALRATDQLRGRREWLQGGRFVAETERNGRRKAAGAHPWPPSPLTELISVFALLVGTHDFDMWKLLGKLHPSDQITPPKDHVYGRTPVPDPEKVDLEGLRVHIDKMQTASLKVAKIVRGGQVRDGRQPESISPAFAAAVGYVKKRAAEGVPPEEIRHEVNALQDRGPLGRQPDFTNEQVNEMIRTPFGEDT